MILLKFSLKVMYIKVPIKNTDKFIKKAKCRVISYLIQLDDANSNS